MSDCFLSGSNRHTCRFPQYFKHYEGRSDAGQQQQFVWPCTAALTQSQSRQIQQAFVEQSLRGMIHNPALTSSLPTLQVLTLLTLPG